MKSDIQFKDEYSLDEFFEDKSINGQIQDNNRTKTPHQLDIYQTITPALSDNNYSTVKSTAFKKNKNFEFARLGQSGFQGITGLKRKLLAEIFLACKGSKGSNDCVSHPISISDFVSTIGNSRKSIERTLYRLIHIDRLLKVVDSKRGRGGWVIYEMPRDLHAAMSQTEKEDVLSRTLQEVSEPPISEAVSQANPAIQPSQPNQPDQIDRSSLALSRFERAERTFEELQFQDWLSNLTEEQKKIFGFEILLKDEKIRTSLLYSYWKNRVFSKDFK